MRLLVIDGNSIVNRAFYGIKLLSAKNGQYTNAITGFFNILNKLEAEYSPDEVAIAFDLKAPTHRHIFYKEYKAHRKGMPPELAQQMPVLKELLCFLGYKCTSLEGYEADDILGTLAHVCTQRGDECLLATGDRDSLQLVSDKTTVLLATTQMGKSTTVFMDEKAVFEKYGLAPKQLIDVKSLMGDASDNIPGVAGVGEKTALTLVQNFGSLDNVYENIDDTRIKKGAREKLLKDKETAYISYKLATIMCDVPIETQKGAYKKAPSSESLAKAARLLSELEMFTMIKKLGLNDIGETGETGAADTSKPQLPPLTEVTAPFESGEVYICVLPNSENAPKGEKSTKTENTESAEHAYCVQNDKIYKTALDSEDFLNLLANGSVKKYCFDAKILYRLAFLHGKEAQNIFFDAKIAAYLLKPDSREYTISELAQSYNAVQKHKYERAEPTVLQSLCKELLNECTEQNMKDLLFEIEMPLCRVLSDMEIQGILVDKKGIENFGKELQTALEGELKIIHEHVGYEFNVNSPKQLGKALFEDMGLPTGKKTKSGYSTNAETLEKLRKYSPVIEHIMQYRTYQKLNSTYVEGLLKVIASDGRIHTTFNQTETRTGRISSGEPNLQNIPVRTELGSRFRKYFIAQEGKTLLDADYSQIELRILAHISCDETMMDAFERNADIHRSTAAKSYGVSEDEVTPQMRSSAKAVNFGIVYGIGAFSLAKDLNISVKQADEFIKTYFNNFPGVKKYLDDTVAKAKENGYVTTLYDRRRNLPELANSNFNVRALGERMAMNTPIQGTAADIIKLAMVRVYDRLKSENLSAKLILQVHDELIVECPQAEKEVAAKIISEEMQNAANLLVPLVADVNSGDNWYDAKG